MEGYPGGCVQSKIYQGQFAVEPRGRRVRPMGGEMSSRSEQYRG